MTKWTEEIIIEELKKLINELGYLPGLTTLNKMKRFDITHAIQLMKEIPPKLYDVICVKIGGLRKLKDRYLNDDKIQGMVVGRELF